MEKIKYKNINLDNALILGAIAKMLEERYPILSEEETLILHAIKRSSDKFADLDIAEIGDIISEYDEQQLLGFANNVKGIAHELQFIEIENENGDSITASIFPNTNHKGVDVMLTDEETGEVMEVQLKATDNVSYVNDWLEKYPDGEILVTDEIAEKMNLKSSGISNEELTTDVNDFIDKVIESSEDAEFWHYIPYLSSVSIAISGYYLYRRYAQKEINYEVFKKKFLKLTGIKVAKFGIISVLLSIPVVNVITGATILFMAISDGHRLIKRIV